MDVDSCSTITPSVGSCSSPESVRSGERGGGGGARTGASPQTQT